MMLDTILQVNIPTIQPWMIQVFTYLIMVFVAIKMIHVITKKMKIDWKSLLDFSNVSHDRLERKAAKTKAKAEKLANEIMLKTDIEENENDIKRYQKELDKLK